MRSKDLLNVRRLPAAAFGLLVAATIGAFFLTQHLKVANPIVWILPTPVPGAIHPIYGRRASCVNTKGQVLDYRSSSITIEVSRADNVGVYIVSGHNAGGNVVATISAGTPMRESTLGKPLGKGWYPHTFTWNGLLSDGQPAPPGNYYFRIVLQHQDRSINTEAPVQVVTAPPQARVTSVQLLGQHAPKPGTPLVFTPGRGELRINYTRGRYRRLWVNVFRIDGSGKPQKVARIKADTKGSWARWNGTVNARPAPTGLVDGQPAPAGTYLAGVTSQNLACDQASWPVALPPSPGTTPGAGISIRYLAVTPPLTPTISGGTAHVAVDSPTTGYTWTLRRSGTAKVLATGTGTAGNGTLEVQMPRHRAGLYTLVVHAGNQSAAVPLVAYEAGSVAAQARVLVVLPMLSWMGDTPVDDTGDGLPDTLASGQGVSLTRPLVDGPPASIGDDAALLNFLASMHRSYQVTTDVALAEGKGPSLVDRWGVLFPDGTDFLPTALDSTLTGFVTHGGRALVLGAGSLRGTSALSGFPTATRAGAPALSKTDIFGAQRGPLTSTHGALITELRDDLNLFGGTVAFTGFNHYQPIEPPASAGSNVSAAGIADGSPAIVGFRLGAGVVTEVGLPSFGSSLTGNVTSQELLNSAWRVLAKLP